MHTKIQVLGVDAFITCRECQQRKQNDISVAYRNICHSKVPFEQLLWHETSPETDSFVSLTEITREAESCPRKSWSKYEANEDVAGF